MDTHINATVTIIFQGNKPETLTVWEVFKGAIISLRYRMTRKKTSGKLNEGMVINRGRARTHDSSTREVPANFVRPKATVKPQQSSSSGGQVKRPKE